LALRLRRCFPTRKEAIPETVFDATMNAPKLQAFATIWPNTSRRELSIPFNLSDGGNHRNFHRRGNPHSILYVFGHP